MKVGDLVRYRYPETDDDKAIRVSFAIVVGPTSQSDVFEVLELSGFYKGTRCNAVVENWEVVSESR
jgi:hypothetical protein